MKQPDTAALRERLANYTPEEELKQDMQELDGLLQEVNCQIVGLRNLLNEIQALKEELHGIHGSLKHTVQRERAAFKALEAAKESADNIVDVISNAIVKAERNTVIRAKVDNSELAKVNQCSANHIKTEKKILEEHSKKLLMCQKTRVRLQMGFCLSLGDSQRLHAVRIFLLYQLYRNYLSCGISGRVIVSRTS